jgi:hypothetical protein
VRDKKKIEREKVKERVRVRVRVRERVRESKRENKRGKGQDSRKDRITSGVCTTLPRLHISDP